MQRRIWQWVDAQRALMQKARLHGRRGMSLVEVMIVIVIIITLMSVLAIGVFRIFATSQQDTTVLAMNKVAGVIEIHMLRKKRPPAASEGLAGVFSGETPPTDSWGNDFIYVTPGPNGAPYDLISLGSDGQEGGTGGAADIRLSENR